MAALRPRMGTVSTLMLPRVQQGHPLPLVEVVAIEGEDVVDAAVLQHVTGQMKKELFVELMDLVGWTGTFY